MATQTHNQPQELTALIEELQSLKRPLTITLTVSPDRLPDEENTDQLLSKLAEGCKKVTVKRVTTSLIDEMILTPRISWNDGKSDTDRFVFVGVPTGPEWRSFAEGLKIAGGIVKELGEPKVVEELSEITKPLKLKTYVTTECPKCPDAAIAGYRFAACSPLISHELIEINTFAWFQDNYNMNDVPKMIMNSDKYFAGGVLPDSIRLMKIKEALRDE